MLTEIGCHRTKLEESHDRHVVPQEDNGLLADEIQRLDDGQFHKHQRQSAADAYNAYERQRKRAIGIGMYGYLSVIEGRPCACRKERNAKRRHGAIVDGRERRLMIANGCHSGMSHEVENRDHRNALNVPGERGIDASRQEQAQQEAYGNRSGDVHLAVLVEVSEQPIRD